MNGAFGPIVFLVASNVFMTFAWYWHLKHRGWPLWAAIAISWLIALPEYCLQVPGNRVGHVDFGGPYSAAQLKVLQEAITLVIFSMFAIWILKEPLRWNDVLAFALIFAGVAVSVLGKPA
ncbi:MAG: DMT family protein [Planctomycetes bacterium]|nr:DMT family protein [Planctomycetota bacterium]